MVSHPFSHHLPAAVAHHVDSLAPWPSGRGWPTILLVRRARRAGGCGGIAGRGRPWAAPPV